MDDRQAHGVTECRQHVLEAQLLSRGVMERHPLTVRQESYKPVDSEDTLYESSRTVRLYGCWRTIE